MSEESQGPNETTYRGYTIFRVPTDKYRKERWHVLSPDDEPVGTGFPNEFTAKRMVDEDVERHKQQGQRGQQQGHDDRLTYSQRVYRAYREIAEGTKFIDVPIHALHRRVGGNIHELHDLLRAECLAHRAVPTVGEPAFAGDAARQSALRLPGEKETFLNIKLIEPPMAQEQQQQSRPEFVVPSPVEQYEYHLRQLFALKYPEGERTEEMTARIEATVQRKLGEFRQEHELRERVKAYEASLRKDLAIRHPDLTEQQRRDYEERIASLVADHRAALARHQQCPQQPARSQEQSRGMEVER